MKLTRLWSNLALLLGVTVVVAPVAISQPINPYVLTAAKIATALGYTPANGSAYCALVGCTMNGGITFSPDATYDIGASGATRPRNMYVGGLINLGGALSAIGSLNTVDGRITQNSGPIIDLRTGTNVRFFDNSGTNPIPVLSAGVTAPFGTIQYMGTSTNASDVYTVTPSTALTAYTKGAFYVIQINSANTTTTPTINISALGAKTVVKRASTALAANDMVANMMGLFVYDGTNLELLNPVVN